MHPVIPPAPASAGQDVRRVVFFLSGFDPKGPGYYHRLLQQEVARYSEAGRGTVRLSARRNAGPCLAVCTLEWEGSEVSATQGPTVRTEYRFLRWDDIVRRRWPLPLPRLLATYVSVYFDALRLGVMCRLARFGRAPVVMMLLPAGIAIAWLCGSYAALLLLAHLVLPLTPSAWLAAPVAVAIWRLAERRLEAEWLLRLYAFTRDQAAGRLPDLEKRLDQFADAIRQSLQERPVDEVLIVGYSHGSVMAAASVARALSGVDPATASRCRVSLLTLGHCTPMLASFPGAQGFRDELAQLASDSRLTWLDYSAPADPAAFATAAPWRGEARGVKRSLRPRFHAAMGPAEYAALRRDRRAMHLQYLRTAPRAAAMDAYDYVAFVAGPLTLAERAGGPVA